MLTEAFFRSSTRPTPPRDASIDSTLDFLRETYFFGTRRFEKYGTDIFEARLMLSKALFLRGEGAARLFYEGDRFTRVRANPQTTLRLLQDKGSVQLQNGPTHRHRKALFMSLMTPEALEKMRALVTDEWRSAARRWEKRRKVILFGEVEEILCRAVCHWAGVPLFENEVKARTREFGGMIDGAGSFGIRNARGALLRARTERWARQLISDIRLSRLSPPRETAAYKIAFFQDLDGKVLPVEIAAVELLNILRPTVAVARFVVFGALALHQYPHLAAGAATFSDDDFAKRFALEVRRFYPFFPMIGGRATETFVWRDFEIKKGQWALLDLYATNHDPRLWTKPDEFRPDRFLEQELSSFNFVPQGGGAYATSHRCPGEFLTDEIMKVSMRFLKEEMTYEVPKQDLTIDVSRLPAVVKSRFVIKRVRAL
jgi:fatty-acid peroxygenase